MLLFDLDHFKSINDRFGHSAGDLVLTTVGDVTRAQLRPTDLIARLGGEEFCVLLPGLNAREAAQIAERVRSAIFAVDLDLLPAGTVSASVGVASMAGDMDLEGLLDMADKRLYRAKSLGRNAVVSDLPAAHMHPTCP